MLTRSEAKLMLLENRLNNYSSSLISQIELNIKKSITENKSKILIDLKDIPKEIRSALFEYVTLKGYINLPLPTYVKEGKGKRVTKIDEFTVLELAW